MKIDIVYYLALIAVSLVVIGGELRLPLVELAGVITVIFAWVVVMYDRDRMTHGEDK